ncbi:MAG: hypothetical protein ABJB74_18965 [Gemmatimonas sp.]
MRTHTLLLTIAACLATPVLTSAQISVRPPLPPPAPAPTVAPNGSQPGASAANGAQPGGSPAAAQNNGAVPVPLVGPPIRRIETASAVSTEPLAGISTVRHLSNGNLLLNDGQRRRLLLMDSSLKVIKVVLDSLTDVENAYGTRAGSLIAAKGDTTFFVDPGTYAMLVIDLDGKIVRTRSVPRAQDASYISQSGNGVASIDAQGRLVYRIAAQTSVPFRMSGDMPIYPPQPDSAFIVGIHLDTRKLDTLGAIRIPRQIMQMTRSEYGWNTRYAQSPLPLVDEWAVTSDGKVAFVRGRDFRVDYLQGDGTTTSSEKLAFPWVRMDDEQKQKFIDSLITTQTRQAQQGFLLEMIVWSNLLNKPYPTTFKPEPGLDVPSGLPQDWILPNGIKYPATYIYACPPALPGAAPVTPPTGLPTGPPAPGTSAAPRCVPNNYAGWYGSGGYIPPPPTYRKPTLIPVSEMPDYKPPIAQSSVRADADGNLWIRTQQMKPMPGGTIYDIVNSAGVLSDRIQIPAGYQLVSFGAGNIVYLAIRDASGLHLARVRLRAPT